MLTTREQERELLDNQPDPVSRSALKATFHVRRYMPLYVFGTIWAVMISAGASAWVACKSGRSSR